MATPDTNDIIVVASSGGLGSGDVVLSEYNNTNGEPAPLSYSSSSEPELTITQVNIHVDNSAHQSEAIKAAQNVAKALNTIVTAAKSVNPNTNITLASGEHITAGKLIEYISETHFVVTDQSYQSQTGGVGASDYLGTMGPSHTDYLDYSQFGDTGYGRSDFGPTGMVGIILHEISHMTPEGYAISNQEFQTYNREVAMHLSVRQPYSETEYFQDNEAYADTTAHAIGDAIGADTSGYFSHHTEDGFYIGAAATLAAHGG